MTPPAKATAALQDKPRAVRATVGRHGPDEPAQPSVVAAAQAEAEGIETTEITWRDLVFTIPASTEDWPLEVTLAFEDRKSATAVRELLGPAQFAQLMRYKPRNRDLNEIGDQVAQAAGLRDAGE